jgi:glycosyltransferase involved in cell wall biosynthesis
MTTLFVVQDAPYPPRSGSPLRAWQHINLLAKLGPVHVFSVGKREADASMPVAASWTHVDSDAFAVTSGSLRERFERLVRPREFPIENQGATAPLNRRLAALLRAVRPDVVVISHWHDALPRSLARAHVLIADAHNVESQLVRDLAPAGGARAGLRVRYRFAQARRRERLLLASADRIWVTSEVDAAAVRALLGRERTIDVVPNAVDVRSYANVRAVASPAAFARGGAGPTIAFAGFFGYPPNADAAAALVDGVFPAVARAFPAARLRLIGKTPSQAMLRAAERDPRIEVTGAVDDVRGHLRDVDLIAVPLTRGSGTRLKILEAFAARIPVIATPKAAEGIAAVAGRHLEICAVAEMPERCVALLRDAARLRATSEAAYDLVCARYSWDALAPRMPRFVGRA